jgi:hypothetical protein
MAKMNDSPVVFISHAHADKERFVVDFAKKLRAKGVDAWIDQWEIQPGDSLVNKIFNEGLGKAKAVIAVISVNSVKSKWVRDELDAATVRRIEDKCRLIPIILDNVPIPESLQHLLQVRISSLDNYSHELGEILNAIFGQSEKPPIGPAPAYSSTIVDVLPNLTKTDTAVMKLACEQAIRQGHDIVYLQDIEELLNAQDVSIADRHDSLEILDNRGYIRLHHMIGCSPSSFEVTTLGFQRYATLFRNDYASIIRQVVSAIVNQDCDDSASVISET